MEKVRPNPWLITLGSASIEIHGPKEWRLVYTLNSGRERSWVPHPFGFLVQSQGTDVRVQVCTWVPRSLNNALDEQRFLKGTPIEPLPSQRQKQSELDSNRVHALKGGNHCKS